MKARAGIIAALAVLVMPATAHASAFLDVTCERVRFDYTQFPTGAPDSSHSTVRVDGAFAFDAVVSFPGFSHRVEVPLNLNDGRPHTIEVRHDWINHTVGSEQEQVTVTCGSPPPAGETPPPQTPPATPPVTPPAAVPPAPTPTTPAGAPAPARDVAGEKAARERAKRQKAKRQRAKRRRQQVQARRERQRARERATSNRLPRTTG